MDARVVTPRRAALVLALVASLPCVGCTRWEAAPDDSGSSRRTASRPPVADREPTARHLAPAPVLRGSEAWHLRHRAMGRQIEGYADRAGAPPGEIVRLRVSTSARRFRVLAYRLGAYRGGSGHLVWRSKSLPGRLQAEASFRPYATRTVVAPWQDSLRLDTTEWAPGAYVLKLVSSSGWQAGIPYVVTSPTVEGKVVVVAPVATWQAYNEWGGYSLYVGPPGDRRAWRVSYDRPYLAAGLGGFGFGLAPVAIAAERSGVDVGYLTDLDLDADPHALDGAAAYVSAGHDEYWTPRMRATVERARDRGVNLAFLGANTMYWRVRLEASPLGDRRTLVGYRSDASLDPERDPRLVTGRFRDPPAASSERRLVGAEYECFPVDAPFRVTTPGWWGFAGTGVTEGTEFPHLVGDEADRVYPGGGTPRPLQVLSNAPYSCRGVPTTAQATYYTAASGAAVLDVGTLNWTCSLTPECFGVAVPSRTRRFVSEVTRNVLRQFSRPGAGDRHPAHDNVRRFDLPRTNTVPAS